MTEPEALILSLLSPREWSTEVFTTSWPASLGQLQGRQPRVSPLVPRKLLLVLGAVGLR
jgi:hypothetical protein